MSTVTIHQVTVEPSSRQRLARLIRSDIANVRSTTAAKALLLGSVVMACLSCVANLATVANDELGSDETVELAMHASTVATLVFAMVAGLVSATADFRFGRVDQLLLSDASRSRFAAAKTLVGSLLGAVYGVFGSLAAVVVTTVYFDIKDTPFEVVDDLVLRPLVGLLFGAALLAACGVAIGIAVQHQAAALAGSLAWILIVEPTALVGLPDVGRWLPGAAGLALTRSPDPNLLGQSAGGVLLLAWTVLAVGTSVVAFRRTDL